MLLVIIGSAGMMKAQCGDELMKQALGAMGNYQYIKDFEAKLPAATAQTGQKFSLVLNSRTVYQINVANGASNAEQVVIEIMDGDKQIGSNLYQGKVLDKFGFNCMKTGAYKLRVYTQNGSEACARLVLSLVKQLPAQ